MSVGTSESHGWSNKKFGCVATFRNGLNFVKSDKGDHVKVVGVSDFQKEFRVRYDNLGSVRIAGSLGADDLLQNNDLLFVRSNGNKSLIGRCILIEGLDERVSFSGFTIRARVTAPSFLTEFVAWYFHSTRAKAQIHQAGEGSHIANLSQGVMAEIEIPMPPLPEQRAIAGALSDVDALIGALDAAVAKKRAIKLATMQQLLTGKTRLPGFKGKWRCCKLGEVGQFSKGRGIKRDDIADEGVGCIRYGELYTRYENYVTYAISRISHDVAQTALPICHGDLLFAGSGETAEEIGKCAAYIGREDAYAGGDIVVLTPSDQNPIYLGHLMNHRDVAQQKARYGQGDAVVHVSAGNLSLVDVRIPPKYEQDAIAHVILDMDAEITALEQRRDKTKAIKQGMMQSLLTGRVRLVEPETTP